MNGCCNNCGSANPAVTKMLADMGKAIEANESKDFRQDGDITQLFNMWRCEVKQAVSDHLDGLKITGELDELLYTVTDMCNPYYSGITTEKKRSAALATDYYVTRVPARDASGQPMRWKLGVANDAYDGIGRESTVAFSHRKNATLAINAGVFHMDTGAPRGSLIKDGRIVTTGTPDENKYQYLAIMADGSFKVYHRTTAPGKMINDGATDAVCIFATLLIDGRAVDQTDPDLEPRQSIGVAADGSTIIITVDGRKLREDAGVTYADLAQLHAEEGSVNAWILDGGGSTSTVLRGVKQNDDIDSFTTDRAVNTFLYIAKETPTDVYNNAFNALGDEKQAIMAKVMSLFNFYNGFLRIIGGDGMAYPGIELYGLGENVRRSKIGCFIAPGKPRDGYAYIGWRAEDDGEENTFIFRVYGQGAYVQTYHGGSEGRPNGGVGLQYFDTTLGKPIWRKSETQWVDATGATV